METLSTLKGKYILVTGAAGGVGVALCRHLFQKEGAHLILVDRDPARLEKLEEELYQIRLAAPPSWNEGQPPSFVSFALDLTQPGAISKLAKALQKKPLQVLINNAGVVYGGAFLKMAPADIETLFEVNLMVAVRLTRALLPILVANPPAHIVNVASGAGLAAPAGMTAYAASKFGLVGFSEALRAELVQAEVGVSVICPVFVKTDIIKNSVAKQKGTAPANIKQIEALDSLVKRYGVLPEEVAPVIVQAILKNHPQRVIGNWAKAILLVRTLFPGAAAALNQWVYQYLTKQGFLS